MALAWPSVFSKRVDMKEEEADLEIMMEFLVDHDAVFYDFKHRRQPKCHVPIHGYIYSSNGQMTHKALVEKIYIHPELSPLKPRFPFLPSTELRFIPPWRMQCFTGRTADEGKHERSMLWFKISKLAPLKEPFPPSEMRSAQTFKKYPKDAGIRGVKKPIDEGWLSVEGW